MDESCPFSVEARIPKGDEPLRKAYIQALAACLALALSGCAAGNNRLEQAGGAAADRPAQQAGQAGDKAGQTGDKSGQTGDNAGQEDTESVPGEGEDSPYKAGKLGDDYILPHGAEHAYTAGELAGLTAEELRIARNEIYARHGRWFKSEDLNRYFRKKSWYEPSVEPDAFDSSVLNRNERDNLKIIKQLEEGRSVCTAPRIGVEDFPVIDGSTAALPLMHALYRMTTGATAMEAEAAVNHHKTTGAWLSLIQGDGGWYGKADLVIAYEPGEQVEKAMRESGREILMKPIGRDALVFLANRSNPVKSLTGRQIADIYSGVIRNWKDVGGRNRAIQAFQRTGDSGSQNLMEKLVMKGTAMADAPKELVSGDMGELIEKVSAYDGTGDALGYSVYYYARNMYRKPELAFMAVDGVMPDSDTIRDKSYPFVNDFYAAVRADEPKDSKAYQLFEWLTTEDGQSLINGLGYVGVGKGEKELPGELTGLDEAFEGSVPLPEGYVILASGPALYGEAGIGVFDSSMRLLQFISHVEGSSVSPYLECSRETVIPAMDTLTGKYGHYSIAENRWADWSGDDTWEKAYRLEESFREDHQDLLQMYGITGEDVETRYYSDSGLPVILMRQGNLEHYYDVYGNHLLDYDTEGKTEDELPYRYVVQVGGGTAYICITDQDSYRSRYIICRDGKPVKELVSNEKGDVSTIGQYFYTRWNGPYCYFYNYKDEACAKFLNGYYGMD